MSPRPPPPTCACGHVYGVCPPGSRCRFQLDPDDPDTRCRCPGFRIPQGPPRSTTAKKPARSTPSTTKPRRQWWR